jgi:hypothetical protein
MTRQVEVVGNYRYVLNTKTDECIYNTNPTNPDGRDITRGSDLYAHKGKKNGNIIFYISHWSRWQGEYGSIEVVSKGQAEKFIIERTKVDTWGYPYNKDDEEQLERYNLNILEEGEIEEGN